MLEKIWTERGMANRQKAKFLSVSGAGVKKE